MKTRSWLWGGLFLVLATSLACSTLQTGLSPDPSNISEDDPQSAENPPAPNVVDVSPNTAASTPITLPHTNLPLPNYEITPLAGGDTYKIGDFVNFDNLMFYVLQWDRHESQFGAGSCVYVDFLLINVGNEGEFLDRPQFGLQDGNGNTGYMTCNEDWSGGYIDIGERFRGRMSYMDPGSDKHLYFVFHPDAIMDSTVQGGRAFVDLGPSPSAVPEPAVLDGEQTPSLLAVGDTVTFGEYSFSLLDVALTTENQERNWPGYVAYRFEIRMENLSGKDLIMQPDFVIKDSNGWEYQYDQNLLADSFGGSQTIAPGGFFQGHSSIPVPQAATGLYFIFDANHLGGTSYYYAIP